MPKLRLFYVVNKALPDSDYRLAYPEYSHYCTVTYGMPGRPAALSPERYVYLGIAEGFRFGYLVDLLRLFQYLRRKDDKIVLVHYYSTLLIILGPLVAKLAGKRSLVTVTGLGRTFSRANLRFRLLQLIYYGLFYLAGSLSERILFQNHEDQATFSRRFPALASKFLYIGSAVRYTVARQKDFTTPNLRVLLVARLMPDKGIEDFLKVAEILQRKSFKFVLIGPESQGFRALYSKVQTYNDRGLISYLGELDSAAITQEYEKAHVFFFPSYGEGMARVMLECGFARVCPVAYDISANRDLVADGRGFLVKTGATQRVVEILRQLQSDRSLMEQHARGYQKHILKHYTLNTYVRRMDAIIKQIALENDIVL